MNIEGPREKTYSGEAPIYNQKSFWKGVLFGIASMLIILTLIMFGDSLFGLSNGRIAVGSILLKINKLDRIVDRYYLDYFEHDDTESVQSIEDSIYSGYIDHLNDPYSKYLNEEMVRKIADSTTGTFTGIGITVTQDRDTGNIKVVTTHENGPSDLVGIKKDDILYKVNGTIIKNMTTTELIPLLRGPKGTSVELVVVRDGKKLTFNVLRDEIVSKTVSGNMINDEVGVINIYQFEQVTGEQFNEAYAELEKQGVKKLIIDLRNNPGGVVDAAVNICEHFVHNKLITYTLNKQGDKREFSTSDKEKIIDIPVVLLVNSNTASASEIMTSAFKYYKLGKVIGENTFGKGIVQTVFDLGDGTALELTIAKYFTPDDKNIQYKGIEPDIEEEFNYKQYLVDSSDNQIDKAIKVLQEDL